PQFNEKISHNIRAEQNKRNKIPRPLMQTCVDRIGGDSCCFAQIRLLMPMKAIPYNGSNTINGNISPGRAHCHGARGGGCVKDDNMNNYSPSFHLPEPAARPGSAPDFSHLRLSAAGEMPRPDISIA